MSLMTDADIDLLIVTKQFDDRYSFARFIEAEARRRMREACIAECKKIAQGHAGVGGENEEMRAITADYCEAAIRAIK